MNKVHTHILQTSQNLLLAPHAPHNWLRFLCLRTTSFRIGSFCFVVEVVRYPCFCEMYMLLKLFSSLPHGASSSSKRTCCFRSPTSHDVLCTPNSMRVLRNLFNIFDDLEAQCSWFALTVAHCPLLILHPIRFSKLHFWFLVPVK